MTGRPAKTPPTTRTCRKCGETKPAEEFMTAGKMTGVNVGEPQRRNTCKECWAKQAVSRYASSRGEVYKPHLVDEAPEGMKTCRDCGAVYPATIEFFYLDKRYPDSKHSYCRPCMQRRTKEWNEKLRLEVLRHYSGGAPKCACPKCGETNPDFLSIDHVDGGGSEHRREIRKNNSTGLYSWLKQNGYPPGFRVLCFNCNLGRQFHGGSDHTCPHLREEERTPLHLVGEGSGSKEA